jgi:hypothetical protein
MPGRSPRFIVSMPSSSSSSPCPFRLLIHEQITAKLRARNFQVKSADYSVRRFIHGRAKFQKALKRPHSVAVVDGKPDGDVDTLASRRQSSAGTVLDVGGYPVPNSELSGKAGVLLPRLRLLHPRVPQQRTRFSE